MFDNLKYLFSKLQAITTTRESPKSDAENKDLCDLALRGLHLLSAWTQQVMELVMFVFPCFTVTCQGEQWLSGRIFNFRLRGCLFEPDRRHRVLSLSKMHYSLFCTGSTQETSKHDRIIVRSDVKHQHKQVIYQYE